MFCRRSFKVAKEFINFAQMSSSETVDQLRQKLAKLDADIDSGQKELVKRKKKVKDLETEVRTIRKGNEGHGSSQGTPLSQETESIANFIQKKSEKLVKETNAFLSGSIDFQTKLYDYLRVQIGILNTIDEKGPRKDGKTFQQKLDEALAGLEE